MSEVMLETPLDEKDVRKLKVGDVVRLSGTVYTARDMAHKYLVEADPESAPFKLEGGVIYHCGPIVRRLDDGWGIVSCGPTTSMREEPYEADVIGRYGVRAVVGKGGMGVKTLAALEKYGCVYLAAVGGAGAAIATSVKNVAGVHMLEEFSTPEAVWVLDVEDFGPLTVGMDSHGKSIYRRVEQESESNLSKILSSLR
jgi:tartrate/fumarate subfamily iron-sulfur-dependent hydro-lyase beta chain